MKAKNCLHNLLVLLFIVTSSYFSAQNLQTELFLNENEINSDFKSDSRIEKLFIKNNKDSILIVAEIKNDSLFSIYVKNNKQSDIQIIPQDNKLKLIQEALSSDKKWKPIEFWVNSDCGISYLRKINVKSGEIIGLNSKKYKGNFNTKIRFKVIINKNIYYSNAIATSINESKFNKSVWYNRFKEIYYSNKSEKEVENILFLN